MTITKLSDGLWHLRAEEADLRIFRSVSFTETGFSYSSYLMETAEGFLSIGSLPERFAEVWVDTIASHARGSNMIGAVFFGVDGDRACYAVLKERWPGLKIFGGEKTLYDLAPKLSEKAVSIRSDRRLTVGGRELVFRMLAGKRETPSLYLHDPETGSLFTADAFGSDCAVGCAAVSQLKDTSDWLRGAQLYFADIYGNDRQGIMEKAVSLVEEAAVHRICPAFGPVVDQHLDELLRIYRSPQIQRIGKRTLAVVYTPERDISILAADIARGAAEAGDVAVRCYDLSALSRETVLRELSVADAFLFGIPSARSKAVLDVLTSLESDACRGKLAAVFYTEGLNSNIPSVIRTYLSLLDFNLNSSDFFTAGRPSEQDEKNAQDYGFGFSCLLQGIPNLRKPSLVKCLVCGEVFDASIGKCPVCGVGLDQCVPVEEDVVLFRRDSERKYLIVGGGIAGVSAAEAIRRRDKTGYITIMCAESCLPINRPMLSKDLSAIPADAEGLAVHDAAWYAERRINLSLGVTVSAVDTENKAVVTNDGTVFLYDKLIYAAGAECFMPPFPGREKKGVLMLRHFPDARQLLDRMETAEHAVVIGGGIIGLETASELARAGLQVTVLEATPQIVGRQIDAESAAVLREAMRRFGVDCYEGVTISEITGTDAADGVTLSDGRHFPAEIVLVSCGLRASIVPAVAAGIAARHAICVNSFMETSADDIYACGDCCELDGINYQLWQEASAQGRTAGANAAGERVSYANQLLGLSLEGFGTSLFAIGDPGKRENIMYKTVKINDEVRKRFESYWFSGGALHGAVLIGAPDKVSSIQQAVITHAGIEDLF